MLIVAVILSLSSVYLFIHSLFRLSPSRVEVHLSLYDYSAGEAVRGLAVSLNITTRMRDTFTISGISDGDGRVVQALPTNQVALPVSAVNISISGVWVLEVVEGRERWSIADEKWRAVNPESFILNSSRYIFDREVYLSHEYSDSKLILRLSLYIARGRLIAVHNPIPEARSLDPRVRIEYLYCNFVEFAGGGCAVIPVGEPMEVEVDAGYYLLTFNLRVSLDVADRVYIDLTPSFIRALSSAQTRDLKRMLDNLKPYGFRLSAYYDRVSRLIKLYDQAVIELEDGDYEGFSINIQMATSLYRDLYIEVTRIYMDAINWVPGLIVIFIFFSASISRLITDKAWLSLALFTILFMGVFTLFYSTQPYLALATSNPLILVQSFTMPTLYLILIQVIPILLFIISISFQHIRSFIWETFEVGIRNLRRRRLKTILALITVLTVSASAMCLLTITTQKPTHVIPYPYIKPIVENGMTIYKYMTQTSTSPTGELIITTFPVPIQQHEVEWFSSQGWVKAMNIYGLRKIRFSRGDGFTIRDFNTFNLIVINSSFMLEYQNVSNILGIEWFEPDERGAVIIGSRIAEAYNLSRGSEVIINDDRFTVKSIFDEEVALTELKDIDGDQFLFRVLDEGGKIEGGSIIFGSLNDFRPDEFITYRLSIILRQEYAENTTDIAHEIQELGYDFGEVDDDYTYVTTYMARVTSGGSVYVVYSSSPVATVSGPWQSQTVLILIASLVLVVNSMGTVAERRSEVRTVYTMGASPLRISLIFITEGLVLGIVGGIMGYIFGYIVVHYMEITLPSLVRENIIGGAPFAVAMLAAVVSSLLGCILPSREAIYMAVPSRRLRQRMRDILNIREGGAYLKVPIRVGREEKTIFLDFLKRLYREFLNYKFINISMPSMREGREEVTYEFVVDYISDEPSSFLFSITVRPPEDLKVIIYPIEDSKTRKICRWSRRHKNNIYKLSSILREELLRFTEVKERSITIRKSR